MDAKNKCKVTSENYPAWTCKECALEAGGKWPKGHVATFHSNTCPVCGEIKSVTEPRDYGYPDFEEVIDEK